MKYDVNFILFNLKIYIMKKKTKTELFWNIDEKGKITIKHSILIKFLAQSGYKRMKFKNSGEIFVIVENNRISEVKVGDINNFIKEYLNKLKLPEVYESFVKGISGYTSIRKLELLPVIQSYIDKDSKKECWFYFSNVAVKVTKTKIKVIPYKKLDRLVWSERILKREFSILSDEDGQFEKFAFLISKSEEKRFKSFKTILGYLRHRYNNPSNPKIVVLYDEKMNESEANGGSGKSLTMKALSKSINIVQQNGKDIKVGSWFRNQRVNVTTDLIYYDDVNKDFNIEFLFAESTSGITIEKKRQDEIQLLPEESPKLAIISNYAVKGPGGDSDIRRRFEFEYSNYFSTKHTPEQEFGNFFFDEWDNDEWRKFDYFLMKCVQLYLNEGLIEAEPINIRKKKIVHSTSIEFESFMSTGIIEIDMWYSKKDALELFKTKFPHKNELSSHKFTKWMNLYAVEMGLEYKVNYSGNNYEFKLVEKSEKEVSNEK